MHDAFENIGLLESHGRTFLISDFFSNKESEYLGNFKKDKKSAEGYQKSMKKFYREPFKTNGAERLKHKLSDFWSIKCNLNRKKDRLIFIRISEKIIYPVSIMPEHKYHVFAEAEILKFPSDLVKRVKEIAASIPDHDTI